MNMAFLKTLNSWHWLVIALVVSGGISAVLWQKELQHQKAKHAPVLTRQSEHLAELQAMDEASVETLQRQTKALRTQLAIIKDEDAQGLLTDLPEGPESVLATKNALDLRLSAHGIRILASTVESPQESGRATPDGKSTATGKNAPTQQLSAAEYAKQMKAMIAALPADLRADAQKDAQRKIAQMEAAEKQAAKKAARTAAKASAASAAPKAAPVKLPFRTQEVTYTVEGRYKDLFLFLVREAARKSPHHLRGIAIGKSAEAGVLKMTFTLQANYK